MANVLITGASRGVGFRMASALHARGDHVIATARRPGPPLSDLGVRVETLDLCDGDSIAALARRLEGVSIDVLIHNAGVGHLDTLESLRPEDLRAQFEVHAVGPMHLTQALLPNLGQGSKVALITSRMGSLSDNTSGGTYAYRMSKAALNMLGRGMSHDLAPRGIAVAVLHPGMVDTDMLRAFTDQPPSVTGARSPEAAAAGLIGHIDALSLDNTGRFLHVDGQELPW